MEKFIDERIQKQVRDLFADLVDPVVILLFTSKGEDNYSDQTEQLLEEVAGLSDKLELRTHDIEKDSELASQYGIDKVPGFILAGKKGNEIIDYRIRYSGIPAGSEFTSLIRDIMLVSGNDSGLTPATREFLRELKKPVHLRVFVTPT
jgi:alkyl hydroperoxide reductase subunit AhpF